MEASQISLKTTLISCLGVLTIETIARLVVNTGIIRPITGLGLARLLDISILILIVLLSEKDLSAIGLSGQRISTIARKGLIWSTAAGIVGINALKRFHVQLPTGHSEIVLFFAIGGVLGPISEELFFRGILYGYLRRWGFLFALIGTTLLFVFAHPLAHILPITQVVGGILFAIAYELEKSLWVPIAIHISGNIALFSLALLV
jgi:membrane protease YdiL (CAAX protease family)